MRTVCLHLVLTLALVASGTAGAGTGTANFDEGTAGTMPAGWVAAITGEGAPLWSLEKDESAPSPPFVLKQSGRALNPSFPLCVKARAPLKDGFAEVKFKPLSGTNDQAAGLVWRYRDAKNYYVVRANALEDNVVLYKVEQGKRKALDIVGRKGGCGVATKVPARQWSTLRVEFAGTRFRVFLLPVSAGLGNGFSHRPEDVAQTVLRWPSARAAGAKGG